MSLQLMCSEEQLLPGWDLSLCGTLPLAGQQLPKCGSEQRAGRNHSGPWQAVTEGFLFFSSATKGLFPGVERTAKGLNSSLA